ncbi:uncharacterized protein LOC128728319 [Anopheles nili]|uniref:uncharacterized protein LOC128728319 n=1 Tax=Anopheles nili TaxID=185578 RepID=UPI00237B00E9|nr:uncharacterized protein LOC128728319 [Anopheles nili]
MLCIAFWSMSNASPPLPQVTRTPLSEIIGIILHTHFRTPFATTLITLRSTTSPGRWFLEDLLDRLLVEHGNGQLVVQLDGIAAQVRTPPWTRSLILAEGYESLHTIFRQLTLDRFNFSGYYLIVLEGSPVTLATVNRIFHELWMRQIVNVVVVIRTSPDRAGPVQLWTYFPFSPGLCRIPKPHLLLTWPNDTILYGVSFYPRKNTEFYGCPLHVGSFETRPFTILLPSTSTETSPSLSGFEGDLLRSLAVRLNFAMDIRVPPRAQQWGYAAFENSTGLMRMIYTEEVDFGLSCLGVSHQRSAMLKAGKVHFTSELVLVVPPGRPYNSLEKLIQPFQRDVWITMLVYTTIGMTVITALRLLPSTTRATVRRYLVGERQVHAPILNIIRIMLAVPIPRTPSGTFPRTLLFHWMLLGQMSILLYQGSMFQYLQRASNHQPMTTLAEIDQSDALFHINNEARTLFEPFPHRMARLRFFPTVPDNIGAWLRWKGAHPQDQDVGMCTRDHVAYYNGKHFARLRIAREPMALYTVTIFYPKRSMLTSSFDDHIERIDSSGLMKYWAARYGDYRFFGSNQFNDHSKPTPVSIGHLLGVIEELIVLFAIAVLLFFAELGWARHTRQRQH